MRERVHPWCVPEAHLVVQTLPSCVEPARETGPSSAPARLCTQRGSARRSWRWTVRHHRNERQSEHRKHDDDVARQARCDGNGRNDMAAGSPGRSRLAVRSGAERYWGGKGAHGASRRCAHQAPDAVRAHLHATSDPGRRRGCRCSREDSGRPQAWGSHHGMHSRG